MSPVQAKKIRVRCSGEGNRVTDLYLGYYNNMVSVGEDLSISSAIGKLDAVEPPLWMISSSVVGTLPNEVGNMVNLTDLIGVGCSRDQLPMPIGSLVNLKRLFTIPEIRRARWRFILSSARKSLQCPFCVSDHICNEDPRPVTQKSDADAIFPIWRERGSSGSFFGNQRSLLLRSCIEPYGTPGQSLTQTQKQFVDRQRRKAGSTFFNKECGAVGFWFARWFILFLYLQCGILGLSIVPDSISFAKNKVINLYMRKEESSGMRHSLDDPSALQETPHAGRHFLPSHPAYRRPWLRRLFWKRRRRFMEGWYYRLTLVEANVSFAFIHSIEDPGIKSSDLTLVCIQVIGPDDTYLVEASKDDTKFWASRNTQALGYTFSYFNKELEQSLEMETELPTNVWKKSVKSGFQILPRHLMGRVDGHDGSQGGVLKGQGIKGFCEFDFVVNPICGWGCCSTGRGASTRKQKSTGGWLSSFPIFEPHWQVTLADARATGFVVWNGTRYEFSDQPFYSEKNWGAALPSKWYWTQCNSFDGYDQLSVTAGGGIRKLPFGQQEALGMISVHHNGTFYEAVPWKGSMEWNVSTWGYWGLSGECFDDEKPFAVEVIYELDPEAHPGLVFRAPTPDQGMVYFCRDTFDAKCTLSLWELELDENKQGATIPIYRRKEPPIIDHATSHQGGAEIGGGPWWTEWRAKSRLKRVIKALLNIPNKLSM